MKGGRGLLGQSVEGEGDGGLGYGTGYGRKGETTAREVQENLGTRKLTIRLGVKLSRESTC